MAVNGNQRQKALLSTHDPSYKGAVCLVKGMTIYKNQMNRDGPQYIIFKERVMSIPSAIFTRKNFYLLIKMNEKLSEFKSAGLIRYWHDLVIDQKFLKLKRGKREPNSLKLRHVVGLFQLLAVGYSISILIFSLELFYCRYEKNRKLTKSRKRLNK